MIALEMTKSLASNPLLGRLDMLCLGRVCGSAAEITPISSFFFSAFPLPLLKYLLTFAPRAPTGVGRPFGQAEKVVVRWREEGGEDGVAAGHSVPELIVTKLGKGW